MVHEVALRGSGSGRRTWMPGRGEPFFDPVRRARGARVAVLVPMSGSAGLWGPSCISCAELALHEINRDRGIRDGLVEAIYIDADDSAIGASLDTLDGLIAKGAVSAIVGMHVSSVRQRLNGVVRGRIPYVYTPLYEGDERGRNVFAIGETPREQLGPAIRRLAGLLKVRRWALIGNDYVWPRASHRFARPCIRQTGGSVVFEEYVPFGLEEPVELVERIAAVRPDIVLTSLIGQEAVEFNRVFGAMGLDRSIVRFSTAIEENVLLATGAEFTRRLYAASSYFSTLRTSRNLAFKERYHSLHRERAPVLNTLGQSIYEGMHFYAALAGRSADERGPLSYVSARGGRFATNEDKDNAIYLALADGHLFSVLERLG